MRQRRQWWIALALVLVPLGIACGSSFGDTNDTCSGSGCVAGDSGQMSTSDGGVGPVDATMGTDASTTGDATTGNPGDDMGDAAGEGDDSGLAVMPVNDAGFMGPSDATVSPATCEPGTYCALVLSAAPEAYFRFNEPLSANGLEAPHDWTGHQYSLVFTGGTQVTAGDRAPIDIDGGAAVQLGNPQTTTVQGAGGAFFLYDADGGGAPTFAGVAPFTLEAWFRLHPHATGQQELFSTISSTSTPKMTNGFVFLAVNEPTKPPNFVLWHGAASTEAQTFGPGTSPLEKGTYYHLAATFDGATAYVYVNGLRGSALSYPSGPSAGVPIQSGLLNGTLDELAIYTRALSVSEIGSHAAYSF